MKARSCPADCGSAEGHGVCNPYLGKCHCHLGWGGADCSGVVRTPCNRDGDYADSSCGGQCDDGYCRCGPGTKFPDRGMGSMRHCPYWEFLLEEVPQGNRTGPMVQFGEKLRADKMSKAGIFGDRGFCNSGPGEEPERTCPCPPDRGGNKCSEVAQRQVCPNLCSGRGVCRRGQCHCSAGAYGVDCSLEVSPDGFIRLNSAAYAPRMGGAGAGSGEATGMSAGRRRPLVYVYELPPLFNAFLLSQRTLGSGTPYEIGPDMKVYMSEWYYASEYMLHEWLLSSEYRTADPAEADFFYVPVYSGLYNHEANFLAQEKIFERNRGVATTQMLVALQGHLAAEYPHWNRHHGADHIWNLAWDEGACSAPRHIRNSTLLDHLGGLYGSENFCKTAFEEDCWSANTEIFDGQLTGIAARAFEADLRAKWTNPKAEHGGYPCTDPDKDITLPPPKFRAVQAPPLLQAKYREKLEKKKLFSFAGDVGRAAHIFMGVPGGRTGERYSHGIRQAVSYLWAGRIDLGMYIYPRASWGERGTANFDYERVVAESVFCGVFVGDGWSGAVVDYVNHGCIPVFIHDTVGGAYSGVLDQSKFSLRVPEVNITNLPYLLADVPPERVAELQRGLVEVQSRFGYESWYRRLGEQMAHVYGEEAVGMRPFTSKPGSDAFETLMEALAAKLEARSRAP